MSNPNTVTMTHDQLKAIINKSSKNGEAGVKTQTSLTDAVKILGVEGNWGTFRQIENYVAPGITLPSSEPSPKATEAERIKLENELMKKDEIDYIICNFTPQAWINDNAMTVDADGETMWLMPLAEALDLKNGFRTHNPFYKTAADLEEADELDDLRNSNHAPAWMKDWSGPFEVSLLEVKLAEQNRPMARAEELVWDAARDAFIMVTQSDTEIQEQLSSLELDDEAEKKLFDEITEEWWKIHAGKFVWGVEVDGTGKVTNHVVDESWGMIGDKIQEMVDAKEATPTNGF